MRGLFTRKPRHAEVAVEGDGSYTIVLQPVTCGTVDARLAAATAEIADLRKAAKDYQRLISNALRVAFNCGNVIGHVLQAESMAPVLGSDGVSVLIEFGTLTVTVLPFDEKVRVAVTGDATAYEYRIFDGTLSRSDQNHLIGLYARSQRVNTALDASVSLTGVAPVE